MTCRQIENRKSQIENAKTGTGLEPVRAILPVDLQSTAFAARPPGQIENRKSKIENGLTPAGLEPATSRLKAGSSAD
jgi:hypothetical protein